jgi:xanthosine utilization system XapX-like protein
VSHLIILCSQSFGSLHAGHPPLYPVVMSLVLEQESPPAPLLALVHVLGAHHGAQARSLIAALIRRRRPSITAILALCSQPQPPMPASIVNDGQLVMGIP